MHWRDVARAHLGGAAILTLFCTNYSPQIPVPVAKKEGKFSPFKRNFDAYIGLPCQNDLIRFFESNHNCILRLNQFQNCTGGSWAGAEHRNAFGHSRSRFYIHDLLRRSTYSSPPRENRRGPKEVKNSKTTGSSERMMRLIRMDDLVNRGSHKNAI